MANKKVKIDIVAQDKTKQAIAGVKGNLEGLKKSVFNLRNAFIGLGAGLVVRDLVNTGKEIENLQVRFKFLFGSVQEGGKAFDALTTFAAKVPFSLEEISAASGNLAVVAKDANQLSKIMEITGNVAAVTGLDFQTTASQIQRAFSGGIAAADIFREKGVRSLLGFEQGAKVSIAETVKAFEETFGSGGKFGGATDELANTFAGTVSMIQDKIFKFKQTINQTFFEELKRVFGDLNDKLEESQTTIDLVARGIGIGLANAVQFVEQSFKFLAKNADTVRQIFVGLIALKMVSVFVSIGTAVVSLYRSVVLLATALQLSYGNFLAAGAIATALGVAYVGVNKVVDDLLGTFDGLNDVVVETNFTIHDLGVTANDTTTSLIDQTAAVTGLKNELEALTFAQQTVKQGFLDQKTASSDAHKAEVKQLKTRKEAEVDTFRALKGLADEGSKRSKKMFRIKQALAIGEAIFNTHAGAARALKDYPAPFSFAIAALTVANGLMQVANIRSQQPPAMFGGARQAGSPFLVGEQGPELFTPASAGTVTPNNQLPGKMGNNNFNFTINAVDVRGVEDLLNDNRATIVNLINSALNDQGKEALV
tara:strand:+ start:2472 stop:4253 length:1782 start_codon:yes stop_codon:yes gene_type:complete